MGILSNLKAKRGLLLGVALLFVGFSAFAADEVVPGEFLVKMKGKPSSTRSQKLLSKVSGKANLKATFGKLNMHHLAAKAGADANALLAELVADEDVEYVEPNYILKKVATTDESKTYSMSESYDIVRGQSGDVDAQGNGYSQSGANTKVVQGWSAMSTSADVPVVAIIDTGVDYNHTVFTNSHAIWTNPGEIAGNGIDDDGNGYIDDVRGWNFVSRNALPLDDDNHGTHVAGIVLGVTQNIFKSPIDEAKIKIMPLKFLDANGSGATSDAISAIYYAVNNGANVINNSWGGSSYSQSLHDAMTYAYNNHVVMVSAAGNYSSDNDGKPLFPSSYPIPSNISVAATNDFDSLASFSNYGKSSVQMTAPGVAIWSTVPGGTRYMSGTSMAAPFVAGLAALAIRESPQLTGYQVANLVINSGNNFSALVNATISGNRANSYDSIQNAKAQVDANATQPVYTASSYIGGRSLASAEAATPTTGCGTVGMIGGGSAATQFGQPKDPPPQSLLFVLALSLVPFVIWNVLRVRAAANGRNRRRFDRFVMNSEIKLKIGDRELVAQMNTISMGGASFKADAMLERGGIVTMQIAGPDGAEQVQVEGRIVWNEANQSYGVQFQDAKDEALSSIQGWTAGLSKAN